VFEDAFRADLIVEGMVLLELKAVEESSRVHARQTLSYLRLTGLPFGYLINFGAAELRNGIKRFRNG
jgi:iron complex transport system substrate-binding protein